MYETAKKIVKNYKNDIPEIEIINKMIENLNEIRCDFLKLSNNYDNDKYKSLCFKSIWEDTNGMESFLNILKFNNENKNKD